MATELWRLGHWRGRRRRGWTSWRHRFYGDFDQKQVVSQQPLSETAELQQLPEHHRLLVVFIIMAAAAACIVISAMNFMLPQPCLPNTKSLTRRKNPSLAPRQLAKTSLLSYLNFPHLKIKIKSKWQLQTKPFFTGTKFSKLENQLSLSPLK